MPPRRKKVERSLRKTPGRKAKITNESKYVTNETITKVKMSPVQYDCLFCSKTFVTRVGLRRHKGNCSKKHENDQLTLVTEEQKQKLGIDTDVDLKKLIIPLKPSFICNLCNKKFRIESSYKSHLKNEHSNSPRSLKCTQCSSRCPDKKALEEHINKRHNAKVFECPHCKQTFTRNYDAMRHLEQKGCDGSHPTIFTCDICSRPFKRKDNLVIHLRTHVNGYAFTCKLCQYSSNGHGKLTKHYMQHHSGSRYECDHCGKVVSSRPAMMKHMEIHGDKKFTCEICKYTTHTVEVMKRHIFRHTGDRPYKCDYCPRSFIQPHQLRSHLFLHTGCSDFRCEKCKRSFQSRWRLEKHFREHREATAIYCPYGSCKYSKLGFALMGSLEEHLKIHGEKTVNCTLCQKSFHSDHLLKTHLKSHVVERPRRCMYCVNARAYIRGEMLIRHIRQRHPTTFREHLTHVRQTLGRCDFDDRLRKDEAESLINLLDALSEKLYDEEGIVLVSNMEEVTVEGPQKIEEKESPLMSEEKLTESLGQLLNQLIDQKTLKYFGWPDEQVDVVLEKVIEQCGQKAADREKWSRVQCLRENAKHLFLYVIEDKTISRMLSTHTIDQVIRHILDVSQ